MIRMLGSIDIDARSNEVYAVLSDLERLAEWQQGVHEVTVLTEGPLRVGARFREVFQVAGRRIEVTCELAALDPGRSFAWRSVSDGPIGYEGRFTLEERDQRTHIEYAATAWTKGVMRLLEPLWGMEARREAEMEMRNLKRLVEASPSVPA